MNRYYIIESISMDGYSMKRYNGNPPFGDSFLDNVGKYKNIPIFAPYSVWREYIDKHFPNYVKEEE